MDPDVSVRDYTAAQREDFLHKPATKMRIGGINQTYEGLVVKVRRLYLSKDRESLQPHIRAFVDRAVTFTTCTACGGARLNPSALSSTIDSTNTCWANRPAVRTSPAWTISWPCWTGSSTTAARSS